MFQCVCVRVCVCVWERECMCVSILLFEHICSSCYICLELSDEILRFWGSEVLTCSESTFLRFKIFCLFSKVLKYRGSEVLKYRGSEVLKYRGSEVLKYRGSEVLKYRGSKVQRFWGFGVLRCGHPKSRIVTLPVLAYTVFLTSTAMKSPLKCAWFSRDPTLEVQ